MLTGEKKVTSLWMRNVGAHTRFNDGSGQLKPASAMCYNWSMIWHSGSTDGLDRWHVGATRCWRQQPEPHTQSSVSDYHPVVKVTGYSASALTAPYANNIDGLELCGYRMLYNWLITRSWVRSGR